MFWKFKKSIRFHLFMLFALVMVAFVLTLVLLNATFLEQYYVIKNEGLFKNVATQVLSALNEPNPQSILADLDRSEGISIFIADQKYTLKYASQKQREKLPREIVEFIKEQKPDSRAAYAVVEKPNAEPKLLYVARHQKDYMVLTKPMKGIRESVTIADEFFLFGGIFALIVGSLSMLGFSKSLTKPIVEMSAVAHDMAELKFERKVVVKTQDELGVLAQSLNTVSDRLKASIENLKGDIEFQKMLSRDLSHEMRTPIGVIKGYAEGLKFGVADETHMRQKYLDTIISECDRMDHMVKELLDLSKLEAKDFVLTDVVAFRLSSLCETVRERFAPIISEHQINFSVECDSSICISANYSLLERLLSNLLSNAIKYNNEKKIVRLSVREYHNQVEIVVFNTSEDIEEVELAKIFDTFYKIDKARSRKAGGHGLGLSIVSSIAHHHGGTVIARKRMDGIEFVLSLPCVQ